MLGGQIPDARHTPRTVWRRATGAFGSSDIGGYWPVPPSPRRAAQTTSNRFTREAEIALRITGGAKVRLRNPARTIWP